MAGFLAALDAEFIVRRTRMPRVTPFPSWNGVIGCGGSDGIVSILSECGRVYLLRLTASQTFEFEDSLCVAQILQSDAHSIMTMCQAWTPRGEELTVARDRQLTIYRRRTDRADDAELLEPVSTIALRFAATTLDVVEQEDESSGMLLVVGSVAGLMVYSARSDGSEASLISASMDDVAVAVTKFSPDKESLAIGTTDGRVMILRRTGQTFSALESPETLIKVLAAPRVTSLTFSPTSDKLIATTRKGNVYVFTRESHQWTLDVSFESLIANPKGGATSQTLSCWWGTTDKIHSTPIFTIAGRSASCNLEMYDVHSRSLLHTLKLSSTNTGGDGSQASSDRHLMGIVSVAISDDEKPPRLIAIDSDATVSVITWPFLTYACPR